MECSALAPARNAIENDRRESEETMANHSKDRTQAEAQFKQAQRVQRATEGSKAMADYVAAGHAVRAKTARLRELRLAKEAADKKVETKEDTKTKKRPT
jgi:hypothetical protein